MLRIAPICLAVLVLVTLAPLPALANGILVSATGDAPVRERNPVKLRGHSVSATIRNQAAEVTVEQVFHNHSQQRLEGTYLFPLPEGAVVSQFAMTMAGKMVEGEVIEAQRAKRIYEGIVRRRRDPGLLEYVGRGMFRARVFPIEPEQDLTIRLTYQQLLPADGGTLELRYPLATDRFSAGSVDSVAIDVRIESDVDLKAIYSPTHRVETTRNGERKARVSYESNGRRQKTDLLLYFARSAEDVGISVLSHKTAGEDGTFMAVLAPKVKVESDQIVPKDVIYVLDTSGSMQGPKIEQARNALIFGVRSLHAHDRFNVLGFSTGVRPFRDALVDATSEAKTAAVAWIGGLQATGGTNIEGALKRALQRRRDSERPAMVVFLTDGRPTIGERDRGQLVANVYGKNASKARVFTFGVGHDLDVKLLDRIAEVSGGARDYVAPEEDIEIVTSRFFRKVNEPVLSDIEVDLGGGTYDVYPKSVSVLFAGTQMVLFGRYKDGGERKIGLKGKIGGKDVAFTYDTTLRQAEGVAYLPRLWAYRKIAFLLDEIRLHGLNKELRDEIVRLGTKHSIVTPYTSGLVVQDEEIGDHVETDNDLPFQERLGMRGLSDAPFEGPANNGTIGMGGGTGGAFGGRGGNADKTPGGGGKKRQDSVMDALLWLKAHQQSDGRWKGSASGPGGVDNDIAVTGLALSAFLGAGYTNRGRHPFPTTVKNGLRHLKNVQDADGHFGPHGLAGSELGHATSALAMVEAYGMTESPIFKASAQRAVRYILASQLPGGGWATAAKPNEVDLAVSSWMMFTLVSARLIDQDCVRRGSAPNFGVDYNLLLSMPGWVAKAKPSGQRGAVEMLARLYTGADPRKDPGLNVLARELERVPPEWDTNDASIDIIAWHHGALAAHQIGGRTWKTWKEAMDRAIVATQRKDGVFAETKGSWDPIGGSPETTAGGRVMSTAILCTCLEVYYRYNRVFGARNEALKPSSKEERIRDSKILQREKERWAASETGAARSGHFTAVGGKTFQRKDGVWTDAAWTDGTKAVRIEAYSDAYFALIKLDARMAKWLALGDRVRFVLNGDAYEIVPEGKTDPDK